MFSYELIETPTSCGIKEIKDKSHTNSSFPLSIFFVNSQMTTSKWFLFKIEHFYLKDYYSKRFIIMDGQSDKLVQSIKEKLLHPKLL